jgi:hypothetical protein
MGVALLNTIAISVAARATSLGVTSTAQFIPAAKAKSILVHATLHGYAVAFWWAAGFFGVGAILTLGLLPSGVPDADGGLILAT